jgi:hypothetical protein
MRESRLPVWSSQTGRNSSGAAVAQEFDVIMVGTGRVVNPIAII